MPNDHTNDNCENAHLKGVVRVDVQQSNDVTKAQNAGAQEINQVEAARTNRHSGSAGVDQELSIEIDMGDGRTVSRINTLTEASAKPDMPETQEQNTTVPQEVLHNPVQIGEFTYDPLSVIANGPTDKAQATDATNAKSSFNAGVPAEVAERLQSEGRHLKSLGLIDDHGRWQFPNPRAKPGHDLAQAFKEWLWNTFNPSPLKSAESNQEFLHQFITGTGATIQVHDSTSDPVLKDFIKSPGADAIRQQYQEKGAPGFVNTLGFGTLEAFEKTIAPTVKQQTPWGTPVYSEFKDINSVAVQVGGFGNPPKNEYPWATASATRCDEKGQTDQLGPCVRFQVVNLAGAHSFLYHATPDKPIEQSGPLRTMIQVFTWVEPIKRSN